MRAHRQRIAPQTLAAGFVELRDGPHGGQQQTQRVIGHAFVVTAGAVAQCDAAGACMVECKILEPGAKGARQPELRHGVDLIGAQPGAAVGQHRLDFCAVGLDLLDACLGGRGVVQLETLAQLGEAVFRHGDQQEQDGFHGGAWQVMAGVIG